MRGARGCGAYDFAVNFSPVRTIVSPREGIVIERMVPEQGADGLLRIEQRIKSHGVVERSIVTGRFWIFATVTHEEGLTEALCVGEWKPLPARRAFIIPPRSVLRLRLSEVRLAAHGIVGQLSLPDELTRAPRAAPVARSARLPNDLDEIRSSLRDALVLDPDEGVGDIARRARRMVYDFLDSPRPVWETAKKMGVAPETVTRAFRRAYRVSPKTYVHGARVSDGVLSLLTGSGVLSAGFDAGFGHPSRFYEVFGRATGNTPGEYASLHDQKPRRRPRRAMRR